MQQLPVKLLTISFYNGTEIWDVSDSREFVGMLRYRQKNQHNTLCTFVGKVQQTLYMCLFLHYATTALQTRQLLTSHSIIGQWLID